MVNIPLDGIHSIMLKSERTSLNSSNSKYDKLEEQLNNIKVKNEIKTGTEIREN